MNRYQEMYQQKKMTAEQALELIQDGDYMFSAQAAGEPQAILSKLQHLKKTGVKGTTLNTCLPLQYYDVMKDPDMKGIMDHSGWFFNAGLRDAQKKKLVSAVPQSSTSILRKTLQRLNYEGRRPVVMATVSPMDVHGYFSLSISAIYERDLIDRGALVLLEVNPNFPRTFGDTQVHISEVGALVESDRPIPTAKLAPYTAVDQKIGEYVASLVEDGSTIQLGIGSLPDAVAHHLMDKKDLGLHTEMFTSSMGEMIRRGVITGERKNYYKGVHVGTFAGGDRALYETMRDTPNLRIVPGSYGVNPVTIMQNDNMVSINTILEMDLTGQVCSESIGPKQHSGSGGGFCFAYGALHSKGGRGILAFASRSKKGLPKIKPMLTPGAAVTIPRNYVDYIVTEYGVARMRGRSVKERAEQLIAIAHPDDRAELRKEAQKQVSI